MSYIPTHIASIGIGLAPLKIILVSLGVIMELWLCYRKINFRDTYLWIKLYSFWDLCPNIMGRKLRERLDLNIYWL